MNLYINDLGIKNVEDFDFYKYLMKIKYYIYIVIWVYDMYMLLCIIYKYKCLKINEFCYFFMVKIIYYLFYFKDFLGVFKVELMVYFI